jgi:hypothetical protein
MDPSLVTPPLESSVVESVCYRIDASLMMATSCLGRVSKQAVLDVVNGRSSAVNWIVVVEFEGLIQI